MINRLIRGRPKIHDATKAQSRDLRPRQERPAESLREAARFLSPKRPLTPLKRIGTPPTEGRRHE